MLRANNAQQSQNIIFQDIAVGEECVLEIDIEKLFGTDVAIFPLHFESMKMFLSTDTEPGERYVTLPGIIEVFAEGANTEVEQVNTGDGFHKFVKKLRKCC